MLGLFSKVKVCLKEDFWGQPVRDGSRTNFQVGRYLTRQQGPEQLEIVGYSLTTMNNKSACTVFSHPSLENTGLAQECFSMLGASSGPGSWLACLSSGLQSTLSHITAGFLSLQILE